VNPTIRKGVLLLYLVFSLALFWGIAHHLRAGSSLQAVGRFDHRLTAGVIALVLVNIAIRFARWQFLLRKSGIRISARSSLTLYVATLALIITPFYVGEMLKPLVLKHRHGVRIRRTLSIVIMERYFDLLALFTIGLWDPRGLLDVGYWALLAAAIGLPVAVVAVAPRLRLGAFRMFSRFRLLLFLRSSLRPSAEAFAALSAPRVFLQAYLASLVAWIAAGLGLFLVARGCGVDQLNPVQSMAAFATATSAGAATFFPGGIGAMEATLNARLEVVAPPAAAWSTVLMVRLLTLWFGVALGSLVLLVSYRRFLGLAIDSGEEHFVEIAPVYDAQIPEHMRRHFLAKKVAPMLSALESAGIRGGRGLDIGCGTGWYARAIREHGHGVVGLDRSPGQVRQFHARVGPPAGLVGDAVTLPFRDATFDFAYAINIIHHLPGRAEQARALAEVRRVLRPGGLFFLHEINVVNPLHRFYMVFVFPVLKDIDEGTERWILPGETALFAGFRKHEVKHFTFLPDFLPKSALALLRPVESVLERSPLRKLSAHFLMVVEKKRDEG
jgi:uncharacterized protein (TIRG00374 family)